MNIYLIYREHRHAKKCETVVKEFTHSQDLFVWMKANLEHGETSSDTKILSYDNGETGKNWYNWNAMIITAKTETSAFKKFETIRHSLLKKNMLGESWNW